MIIPAAPSIGCMPLALKRIVLDEGGDVHDHLRVDGRVRIGIGGKVGAALERGLRQDVVDALPQLHLGVGLGQ